MQNTIVIKKLFLALALLCEIMAVKSQTVSSLVATGTGIKWYAAATGGSALSASTPLVNGTTYYASQTVDGVESSVRMAVMATVVTQAAPTAATHTPSQTQIIWNWNSATGATGYKWSATDTYVGATDLGNVLAKTETGLTCNTAYTRYIWDYNGSGCVSGATMLTQTTSSCVSDDAIYNALSTSRASYTSASAYDLVKITSAEYAAVKLALSAAAIGYTGAFSDWATGSAGDNTTFSYNNNGNDQTTSKFSALYYPVALSFHPASNPASAYTCQLKYNNGGTVVNISGLYSGATAATVDRQYFVIKTPAQLPNSTPYISLYCSKGVATVYGTNDNHYWDWVNGNATGSQTFNSVTGAITQLPSLQVLQTATKQWP